MASDLTTLMRPTVRDAWNAAMAACDQADAAPSYAEAMERIGFAKRLLRGIRAAVPCDDNAPFPPQEPPYVL
jgi:hypothetical protein